MKIPYRAGYIQITFITGNVLRDICVGFPDVMKFLGYSAVFFIVAVHKDRLRAKPVCLLDIHSRVDAKLSGNVIAGGDNATLMWLGADNNRPVFQFGIVPDFDRSKKCIHIHMYDDPLHNILFLYA
jgi:hypothetical protein